MSCASLPPKRKRNKRPSWAPNATQRSGRVGERTSSEMNELSPPRRKRGIWNLRGRGRTLLRGAEAAGRAVHRFHQEGRGVSAKTSPGVYTPGDVFIGLDAVWMRGHSCGAPGRRALHTMDRMALPLLEYFGLRTDLLCPCRLVVAKCAKLRFRRGDENCARSLAPPLPFMTAAAGS